MKLKNLIQKNVLNLPKFLVCYLPSAYINMHNVYIKNNYRNELMYILIHITSKRASMTSMLHL